MTAALRVVSNESKANALCEYAVGLHASGDETGAYKAFVATTRIDANCETAWINLGDALTANRKAELAVICHAKALAINGSALNHLRYANALSNVLQYEASGFHFRETIKLDPTLSKAWYGLAHNCMMTGRLDEARGFIDRAKHIDADVPDIRYCSAVLALCAGDWQLGFGADYDEREKIKGGSNAPKSIARWQGESLRNKHLHLYAEQGFGDVCLMLRFLRYVKNCRLTMLVPKEMRRLIDYSINRPDIGLFNAGALPDDFRADYCLPLGSIPRMVMEAGRTFSVESRPYLFAPDCAPPPRPANVRKTVGVVWQGDPRHVNDRHRSVAPEDFVIGLARPGVELYSLQLGELAIDPALLGDLGVMQNTASQITDWLDTAALIKQLDTVVSVDTGVINLAGAMGKEAHVVVPYGGIDWRWQHGVERSPWYPSITIHRQQKGEHWRQVLERVPL